MVIKPVRPLGPEAIVANPDVKAAFGLACANHAVGAEAKAGHALAVGIHMRFANEPAAHARLAQVIPHCPFAHPQRRVVPLRPVAGHIAPGVAAHPCGTADGRLHIGVGEPHATFCQLVDMGRFQMRMTGAAQVVEPQLVEHDKEDIHSAGPTGVSPKRIGQ